MGLSEKIANAESSDWLREGMTDEEVSKIISEAKEEARERIKLIGILDDISTGQKVRNDMVFPTIYDIAKEVAEKALDEITYDGKTIREWAEVIAKQQPCEDCISREATLKAFAEKCGGECDRCEYNGSGYYTAENCKLIKSMPSVTPKPNRCDSCIHSEEQDGASCYECVKGMADNFEAKPCEDAISRAALLEELGEEPFNWNDSPEEFQEVRDYQWFRSLVENAPSVAPETKTGYWIRQTDDYHDYYECEHCGIAVGLDDIRNYCPNCGCRMKGEG